MAPEKGKRKTEEAEPADEEPKKKAKKAKKSAEEPVGLSTQNEMHMLLMAYHFVRPNQTFSSGWLIVVLDCRSR